MKAVSTATTSHANAAGTDVLPTIDTGAWDAALGRYREAWALVDSLGDNYTNEESDAVFAIAFPAVEALIDTPAPTLAAVSIKMEAAKRDGRISDDEDWEAIQKDIQRLAGMEAVIAANASGHLFTRHAINTSACDATIFAAFDQWISSRNFVATSGGDKGQDEPHWDVIDRAEKVICSTPANSVKAAEAALWIALDHTDEPISEEVRGQNLAALLSNDELDWNTKLLVRAIANLRAVAAEAA